jgi:hypothetical protein
MPVIKRDINTRSIDEFSVSAQKIDKPKTPPKIRVPRQTALPEPLTKDDIINKYVKEYGSVSSYKVLILDSKAPLEGIISVFTNLRSSLESRKFNKAGILLVENDSVIRKYQSELRSLEVQLPQDWAAQGSDYRIILGAAKEFGTTYRMIKEDAGWTYKEVKGK